MLVSLINHVLISNVFIIIHTTTKIYSYITCTFGEADGPAVNPDAS